MPKNFTYVDNSNVFIEGSRVSAVKKGLPGAATIIEAMNNRVVDFAWQIDTSGKYLLNPTYDNAFTLYEGLAGVCVGDCGWEGTGPKKWGYIDKNGAVIVPPQFGRAYVFQEGLAPVCVGPCMGFGDKFQGKWGYISPKGAFVINPQFDNANSFEDGLAKVELGKGDEAKTAYIDKTGKFIWNPAN